MIQIQTPRHAQTSYLPELEIQLTPAAVDDPRISEILRSYHLRITNRKGLSKLSSMSIPST
jgi:hypothetical protein